MKTEKLGEYASEGMKTPENICLKNIKNEVNEILFLFATHGQSVASGQPAREEVAWELEARSDSGCRPLTCRSNLDLNIKNRAKVASSDQANQWIIHLVYKSQSALSIMNAT